MTLTQISQLSQAKAVAGGYGHSLAISSTGALFSWGLNDNYQLGNGTNISSLTPTQIGLGPIWTDVACGDYHSLALNSVGEVYAWGRNVEKQCGTSSGNEITTPTKINFANPITKIAASSNYSLFLETSIGTKVFGCGLNSFYLLSSTNLNQEISTPTEITDFSNAVNIAAGNNLCVVSKGSELVVRGVYDFTYDDSAIASFYAPSAKTLAATVPYSVTDNLNFIDLCVGNKFLLGLKENGSIWGYTYGDISASFTSTTKPIISPIGHYGIRTQGYNPSIVAQNNWLEMINNSKPFEKIKCGRDHVLLIDSNKKLYSWGANGFGQLGRVFSGNDTNIVEITGYSGSWTNIGCGSYHSLAILNP